MAIIRSIYISFFITLLRSTLAQVQPMDATAPWSLQKCMEYAVANNFTLKEASLNSDVANINYEQSRAQRLPNLNASIGQSLVNGTSIDPITSNYVSQQIQSGNSSVNSQVTLYGGNQIGNQIKQNRQLVAQNSLYEQEAKNNIVLNVSEAYWTALYYHAGIKIARDNHVLSIQQLDQIQAKYNAGSLTSRDLAEANSQKAASFYNLVVSQNTFAQQVLVLKQLLELDPTEPFAIDTSLAIPELIEQVPSKKDMYDLALTTLPEIQAARMQIDINRTGLSISRGAYLPSLTMNGRLYTGYTNTRNIEFARQLGTNFNQQVGLSLNIPIFNRKQTWARVAIAKVNIDRAKYTYTTAQKDLYRNVETAWLNANARRSESQAAMAQKEAAQVAFTLAQQQFDLGLINPTDLRIIQNTLFSAEQRYIQSKFQYVLYDALIQFYQGTLIK
ncbi:MAG TPA: TolC family protein [Cytophagales bacterium]|nr:TolC family protein [Cytophagales bacterium]